MVISRSSLYIKVVRSIYSLVSLVIGGGAFEGQNRHLSPIEDRQQ
jgi:hypothetical protein